MSKKNYIPQPIDTKDVELPEELVSLAEDIAKLCMRYGQKVA